MPIFDRYLLKSLTVALVFVSLALAGVIFLTQSLRFLELVMNSGASAASFWILTLLALPRFFEIILPIGLMTAVAFVYNRMTMDSELAVMRATGSSPMMLARPALILAMLLTIFLLGVTTWISPASMRQMYSLRQAIQSGLSAMLFREGVFTPVGNGLTVFVRERGRDGELRGLMIHDSREELEYPVTILAQSGSIVATPEGGQKVVVYDGSRQEYKTLSHTLTRLDFERYTIDLPETVPVQERWREPDERTLSELLDPDPLSPRDMENLHAFRVEAHKRIVGPLLAPAYAMIALVWLLTGASDRRGQGRRVLASVLCVIALQSLYLAAYNISRQSGWGVPLMYASAILPTAAGLFLLGSAGETLLRRASGHKPAQGEAT